MKNTTLLKIAKDFGSPVYVYDADTITNQYKRLTKAFGKVKNLKLNYAVKALSNISVLKLFNTLGSGIDTVSIQEVQLGLAAGFKPENIIFTPNGVSLEEIEKVSKLGVQINIDNLSILEQFGTKHPNIPVCIRINPHVMAGGNTNISVGHIDSKFGISIHQIPLILRTVENTKMNINGIHMHTGSDILDIDNEFCKDYGKDLTLAFEPGKFLVSEAGVFLAKVNVVKQTTSTVFAQIDSGFNHLIRPMLYGSQHDITNISNPKGRERFYSVVGYICETDTFANNRRISEINEGDILCFKNAGAYCYSMASNYNSRYRPAEVLIHKGKAHLIRKRETFDDILHNQVELSF